MSSKHSAKAILVCPCWPSPTILPLLFKAVGEFQSFIKDVFVIEDGPKNIKLGNYRESLIGSDQFQGSLIAFQLIIYHRLLISYCYPRYEQKLGETAQLKLTAPISKNGKFGQLISRGQRFTSLRVSHSTLDDALTSNRKSIPSN